MEHLLYFSNKLLWYTWIKVQTVTLKCLFCFVFFKVTLTSISLKYLQYLWWPLEAGFEKELTLRLPYYNGMVLFIHYFKKTQLNSTGSILISLDTRNLFFFIQPQLSPSGGLPIEGSSTFVAYKPVWRRADCGSFIYSQFGGTKPY